MERFRNVAAALLGGVVLALPAVEAAAATTTPAAKTKTVTTKKLVGPAVQASRWGDVQITVTVRLTRSGSGKVTRRYTNLGGHYSFHTARSEYIMSQALPMLRQEFMAAQSGNVQAITGATDTSNAFLQSLQAALLKQSN